MKNDRETKAKLLASAKKEFMEKGYMQASLRNICKNAGVTTGALYFFFQDKEALFASLVEEPVHQLYEMMKQHYEEEIERAETKLESMEDFAEDFLAAKFVIHCMYQHYEEFQLILIKGQGSRYEKIIDQFVAITERHYRIVADKLAHRLNQEPVEDYMIHWMAHMHIDLFVHMLTHEKSEEAALSHIKLIMRYLISGWMGVFGLKLQ